MAPFARTHDAKPDRFGAMLTGECEHTLAIPRFAKFNSVPHLPRHRLTGERISSPARNNDFSMVSTELRRTKAKRNRDAGRCEVVS